MGVPRQELWVNRVIPLLYPCLTFGVGGLFDFLSGRIPRAPRILQTLGMEWAYRLCQEPSRMWKRYLIGNPLFIARTVRTLLRSVMSASCLAPNVTVKRFLDVFCAVLGSLVLFLPMLIVAAAIRLTSSGPAIFRQRRVGKDGEWFTIYKFRTMYNDSLMRFPEIARVNDLGSDSVTFKMAKDPRVTPIGRWLRRSSMDELPQLWNVMTGEMSLVGPQHLSRHFRRR
jgi:hypothetical protein